MTQFFRIHPSHPEPRLVSQAVAIVRRGGLIAYPTDSSYALGCELGNGPAIERIRRIRRISQKHDFTLLCSGLNEMSGYATLSNANAQLIREHTPGPYTFVLPATREVPKRLQHPKKATVGLRIPEHPTLAEMLGALGEALISSTLTLPEDDFPLSDPQDIFERLSDRIELVIDGGPCGYQPTSVVDLTQAKPVVLRHGRGDVSAFL
ncbi:MAG: threonylcarbamoyl-AMP synthase [Gammaproteobacteria bacterium]|nr:threonylcarbamoyl-AMP synthase [Gammaproteobacteria bacterium]